MTDPDSVAAEEALRVARVTLESFVHQQTPTKTLSGEAHGQLARLVDALIDAARSSPASPGGLDVERQAVVAAARRFLEAHDRVIAAEPVTRDDTFAMKNAADVLRDVLYEYDLAARLTGPEAAGGGPGR